MLVGSSTNQIKTQSTCYAKFTSKGPIKNTLQMALRILTPSYIELRTTFRSPLLDFTPFQDEIELEDVEANYPETKQPEWMSIMEDVKQELTIIKENSKVFMCILTFSEKFEIVASRTHYSPFWKIKRRCKERRNCN